VLFRSYVAEASGSRIWKIEPDGTASVYKSGITNPTGLVFDPAGNLLVAQYQLSRITMIQPNGTASTFMTGNGLNGPVGMAMDDQDNLYIGNFNDGRILKRTAGGTITVIGDLPGWLGFITLAGDAIYATGFQVHRIYKVPVDGSGATVFAGSGVAGQVNGDLTVASFNGPNGIVASPDGNTLYISEYNSRSIRVISDLNGVSAVESPDLQLSSTRLELSPNPFNPTTVIRYELPVAAHVSLKVFDVRGRQVADLVSSHKAAGPHEIRFSGNGLPSGIYFSRLQAGDVVATAKMMLAK